MIRKYLTGWSKKGVFYYTNVGCEDHGRVSYRLWTRLIPKDDKIKLFNKRVDNVKSGNPRAKNLVYDSKYNTFDVLIPCGYRGESWFSIEELGVNVDLECESGEMIEVEGVKVIPYFDYASERGSLGVSVGALISVPMDWGFMYISWGRSGRLYGGDDHGVIVINSKTLHYDVFYGLDYDDVKGCKGRVKYFKVIKGGEVVGLISSSSVESAVDHAKEFGDGFELELINYDEFKKLVGSVNRVLII